MIRKAACLLTVGIHILVFSSVAVADSVPIRGDNGPLGVPGLTQELSQALRELDPTQRDSFILMLLDQGNQGDVLSLDALGNLATAAELITAPNLETTTIHFIIHYTCDPGQHASTQQYIDTLAHNLEQAWQIIFSGSLSYLDPETGGDGKIDVYVSDIEGVTGNTGLSLPAATWVIPLFPPIIISTRELIIFDNNRPPKSAEALAAHELYHHAQYKILDATSGAILASYVAFGHMRKQLDDGRHIAAPETGGGDIRRQADALKKFYGHDSASLSG